MRLSVSDVIALHKLKGKHGKTVAFRLTGAVMLAGTKVGDRGLDKYEQWAVENGLVDGSTETYSLVLPEVFNLLDGKEREEQPRRTLVDADPFYMKVVSMWNTLAEKYGLPKVHEVSRERVSHITARTKASGRSPVTLWSDFIDSVEYLVKTDPALIRSGWFDLDYCIRSAQTFEKVLDRRVKMYGGRSEEARTETTAAWYPKYLAAQDERGHRLLVGERLRNVIRETERIANVKKLDVRKAHQSVLAAVARWAEGGIPARDNPSRLCDLIDRCFIAGCGKQIVKAMEGQ